MAKFRNTIQPNWRTFFGRMGELSRPQNEDLGSIFHTVAKKSGFSAKSWPQNERKIFILWPSAGRGADRKPFVASAREEWPIS